jgi:hypothetical protein
MVARVTLAEIDAVRTSVHRAVEEFETAVLPELADEPGYEGCYVLTTPEGKALVLTFWADEQSAGASLDDGRYAARVERFVSVLRSPPGRESYDVSIADVPSTVVS